MAMLSINDLPEDVLVELLSHVAEYDLIHCCRLVCSLWRDVVDMPTLWKRKCQLEGFSPKGGIRIPDDWKSFYFLFKLRKNLIRNPCAKEGFNSWRIDEDGGDKWAIEELPGGHGQPIPLPDVKKYFVTSFSYAARYDCGCQYEVCVQLLSEDFIVLQEFCPEPVLIDQWSDAKWRQMSHTFRNYGPGVRHIKFQHGGKDRQFWAGWYGVRVTSSSLVIEPPISDGQ
ncbi:F-box only protein 6-like isoform X2 [Ambystoma mexicanum]|uniref:F-box only protein 6-like isoform X2 n=1 Tax=Ambystoma mexicanum TaxID=8296 RepID=UPI0037E91371